MLLYHGSNIEVARPDVLHSRANVDFGRGFYTTSLKEQAVAWCNRYKRVGDQGIVSSYDYDESKAESFSAKQFESYDGEWLDFIMRCRRGTDESTYDIVEGGIANDRVFDTIELYSDGLIDRETALQRLAYEKPNHQICFRMQAAIDVCLTFTGSEEA